MSAWFSRQTARWFGCLFVCGLGLVVVSGQFGTGPMPGDARGSSSGSVTVSGRWKTCPPETRSPSRGDASTRSRLLRELPPRPPAPGIRPPAADPGTRPRRESRPAPVRHHVVRKGERLWDIAGNRLGAPERWNEIVTLNPEIDPDRLRPGTELRLPPDAQEVHPPEPPWRPANTHIVARGETLSEIARIYYPDGDWRALYEANRDRIPGPDDLSPGIELRVPVPAGARGGVPTRRGQELR